MNLLSNAIKFTREGNIRVEAKQKEEDVFIDVIDTGIGIKPEDLSKLFTEYYMVNDDNNKRLNPAGNGLGLYLSRSLALLMKGDITAKSIYGKGTKFTVKLPVGTNNTNEETKVQNGIKEFTDPYLLGLDTKNISTTVTIDRNKKPRATNFEDSRVACFKHKKVVLVVDDDYYCALMLSRLIEMHSLNVERANNGVKAIEMVEARVEDPYALIIMDINMPEMSGLEVKHI